VPALGLNDGHTAGRHALFDIIWADILLTIGIPFSIFAARAKKEKGNEGMRIIL
jgi:hypothetical protein